MAAILGQPSWMPVPNNICIFKGFCPSLCSAAVLDFIIDMRLTIIVNKSYWPGHANTCLWAYADIKSQNPLDTICMKYQNLFFFFWEKQDKYFNVASAKNFTQNAKH